MGLGVTLTAAAVPQYLAGLDEVRARGAAHHVSGRLQRARMEAVKRSAMVGVQFTPDGRWRLQLRDVSGRQPERCADARHSDRASIRSSRLPNGCPINFPASSSAPLRVSPPVDPGGTPPGTDPIRLGSGNIASFSAVGTSTSGTIYIRGRRDAAVRGPHLRRNRQDAHVEIRFTSTAMETVMKRQLTRSTRGPASGRVRGTPHRIGVRTSWTPRAADRRVVARSADRDEPPVAARHGRRTRRSRAEPIARAFEDGSCAAPSSGCVRRGSVIAAPSPSIAICRGSLTNAGKSLPRR